MNITTIASLVTSITVIITCIYKIYNLARRVEDKLDSYDKNIEQLNLHLNKIALLDTNLPLIDRIRAGELYLKAGGNGIGKKIYEQLLNDLDTTVWNNNKWAHAQSKESNDE